MVWKFLFVAAIMFLAPVSQASNDARVISWDDLAPAGTPLKDPFEKFGDDVLDDLEVVFRGRADLRVELLDVGSAEHQDLLEAEKRLRAKGVDVDDLFARLERIEAEIERRNQEVVPDLEGSLVRLPGYALPLRHVETGVKEFLLVPYVGACIHSPPPPANQMVFVRLDENYVVKNLYEPIWVTGQIHIEQISRSLSYVDGESNVESGYTMKGVRIEPYK
jgi:uncharacterized protein